MPAKSLNLDNEVLSWIEKMAKDELKSESRVVNEVLRVCIEEEGRKRHGRK